MPRHHFPPSPPAGLPRRASVRAVQTGVQAWQLVAALAVAATAPGVAHAIDEACQRTAQLASPPLAQALATTALREHALMGGALIDAGGGLIRQGFAEAEQDRAPQSDRPTWQRVWGYWQATPGSAPPLAGSAGALAAQRRAALMDQPWSAAFIAHVMRQAGLGAQQFRFSASHHEYVRAAFASTEAERQGRATPYAYRTCDLAQTAPRVGDLLCFARDGDGSVDTFDRLRQVLAGGTLRMHCDLVVRRNSAVVEAVGGNVVQSVTLRQLGLESDGSGRLWSAYFESAHRRQAADEPRELPVGEVQVLLPDMHLNRKPWSVLLQLRGVAPPEVLAAQRDAVR